MEELISPGIYNLIIFVLAIYVGYHVVWNVTPALHTPLMAVTNAISAIVIVGAMLAAALTVTPLGKTMGTLAVALAAVNVFGGFLVTRRMLEMFKKKAPESCKERGAEVMSMNLVTTLYLIASICFIQALKGLSHPTTSRRGNLFGMLGMALAVLTTVGLIYKLGAAALWPTATAGIGYVIVGLLIGGTAGSIMAKRVEMTKMPELVAFMHSMIGLAAVFIAIAAVVEPQSLGIVKHLGDSIPAGNRLELFLGAAIGAITFSGSVIAFGKLSGKYKFRLFQGAPVQFAGQHKLNLVLGLADPGAGRDLHADRQPQRLRPDAGPGVRDGRADHHPDRRRRHAGGGVDAQQLLRLGGGGYRLLAEQLDADHCRLPGGLVRCDPLVHHVQGDERSFFNVLLGGFGNTADAGRGRHQGSPSGEIRLG